jgi:acetyl-CoA carboxylase alpha subunit
MIATLRKALAEVLRHLQEQPPEALLEAREDKILGYGKFKEIVSG